jgi:hypothetical protein
MQPGGSRAVGSASMQWKVMGNAKQTSKCLMRLAKVRICEKNLHVICKRPTKENVFGACIRVLVCLPVRSGCCARSGTKERERERETGRQSACYKSEAVEKSCKVKQDFEPKVKRARERLIAE